MNRLLRFVYDIGVCFEIIMYVLTTKPCPECHGNHSEFDHCECCEDEGRVDRNKRKEQR
jgi:hypothetical protein